MENSEDYREIVDNEIVTVDFTDSGNEEKRRKQSIPARLVYAALSLVVGVVFITARNRVFDVLGFVVGGMLLVTGVAALAGFLFAKHENKRIGALIGGVLEVLGGIYCLIKPDTVANLAVYVFALIIFLSGIVLLYFASSDKRIGFSKWKWVLLFGIVLTVLGAAMLLFVKQSQAVIAVMVGVSFIISSVLNVLALIIK